MRRCLAALLLVAAACGDAAVTATTVPPAATTSIAATTSTTTTTTTVPPATTTTAARPAIPPLPALAVPDAFVDRSLGMADALGTEILGSEGDWFLIRSGTQTFVPVPGGWEVDDRPDATELRFGSLDIGGVEVLLERDTAGTDIAELLADVESDLDEGDELFRVVMIDADRAYFTGSSIENGVRVYGAAVLVRRDGALLVLAAVTAGTRWDEFEPVFRAMVAGWHDLAGEPLGFELPADLGFPAVVPPRPPDPPVVPPECAELIDTALGLMQGLLDELSGVTLEEWNEADGDFTLLVDAAFEEQFEALDELSEQLVCDEDDLAVLFASRFGELEAEGEVPELFLELLQAITIEE